MGNLLKSLRNITQNSVYDLCLDPALNKLTIKRYFLDNVENLNINYLLNDIKE